MRHYLKLSMLVVLLTMVVSLTLIKTAQAADLRIDCKYLSIYVNDLISSGRIVAPPADETGLRNLDSTYLKSPPYDVYFTREVLARQGFTDPVTTRSFCSIISDTNGNGIMDAYDPSPAGTPLAGILYSPPSTAPSPELRPDCQAIAERVEELIRAGTIAGADVAAASNLNPETIMSYREDIVGALGLSRDPDLSIATCSCVADADSDRIPDCQDEPTRPGAAPERLVMRSDCTKLLTYIKQLLVDGKLAADIDYLSLNPGLLTGMYFTDEKLTRAGISDPAFTRQNCSITLDQDSDSIADAYDTEPIAATVPTPDDVTDEIARLRARIVELEAQLEALEDGEIVPGTEVPVITTPLVTPAEDETRDAGPSMLEGGGGTGGCSFIPPGN
ncbi:MAG: hypothetical protein ABH859_03195 [Pseudomonadota bacterium]